MTAITKEDASALQSDGDVKIPIGMKLGWGFGCAGQVSMLYVVNLVIMYYMVTFLGVSPGVTGLLLFATRIWDSVIDPPIGHLSDRLQTRWGRRRPWMAAGAVVSAISILGVFTPLAPAGSFVTTVQVSAALLLFYLGYSLYSVPGTAMAAEMTENADERTSLMTYRTFFFQVGGLFAAAGLPFLIGKLGGDRNAYAVAGVIAATFVLVSMLTSVTVTAKARRVAKTSAKISVLDYFTTLASNRALLVLVGAKSAIFLATASTSSVTLFYVTQVLKRDASLMGMLQLVSNLTGIAMLPFWRWLAKQMSKAQVFALAMVIAGCSTATWLLASPTDPDWMFWLRSAGTGIGSAGSLLMTMSVLPDTIDSDAKKTGLRREGMYAAAFEFVTKLAFAGGPLLIGVYLSANGYVAGKGAPVVQTDQAIQAVRLAMGLLPPLCYAAGLALIMTNQTAWAPKPPKAAA